MSLLRTSKVRSVGSAWERLCGSFFRGESRRSKERKNRRLQIDQLEERTLLSVSVTSLEGQLINQTTNIAAGTVPKVASDNNGDFVVVWQQTDPVLQNGLPVVNPGTQQVITQDDIYARYYTNDVQQIALPASVLTDVNAAQNKYPTVALTVGGPCVQEISFSTTTPSNVPLGNAASDIIGGFKLTFTDLSGVNHTTPTIDFNETTFGNTWASALSAALSSSATTFTVNFDGGPDGHPQLRGRSRQRANDGQSHQQRSVHGHPRHQRH